jgi:hypothetical protein
MSLFSGAMKNKACHSFMDTWSLASGGSSISGLLALQPRRQMMLLVLVLGGYQYVLLVNDMKKQGAVIDLSQTTFTFQ